MADGEITVAMAATRGYALHAAEVAWSARRANGTGLPLRFVVAVEGQDDEEVQDALRALDMPGASFEAVPLWRLPLADEIRAAAKDGGYPAATFAKLPLCDYAGGRALWLDCDVVLLDDGALRLALEDQGAPVAAVPDAACNMLESGEMAATGAGTYFNAGVMVVDRARCRELGVLAKYAGALAAMKGRLKYADQTAMNAVFARGGIRPLGYRYNCVVKDLCQDPTRRVVSPACRNGVSVAHFAGGTAYWNDLQALPGGAERKTGYPFALLQREMAANRASLLEHMVRIGYSKRRLAALKGVLA